MMTIHFRPLALFLVLGGCAQQSPDQTAKSPPIAGTELSDEAWTQALIEHRDEIREEFRTSKTSPMAGAQRLTSDPAERVFLTHQDRTFALAYAADPAAEMTVTREGTAWSWKALGEDAICEVDGEPVATGSVLAGPAGCDIGEFHLGLYPGDDAVTFIVYDPERPEKAAFEHLLYFPPDRTFAVEAELQRFPEPAEIEMLTSKSLKKTFYRYARMKFQVNGEDHELTAFKYTLTGEGSESLFIPFRDATSGRETYGAGRFMDLEEPEGERFVLDFNRAYNPLCNYSPAYNCPIPPRENRLEAAIRAGELTYPH
jgi:hypothetical protein